MDKDNIDLKNKTILILDDNEITRDSLKKVFEASGAKVYVAGHIGKGSSILTGLVSSGNIPALIVTDVKLPGTFGFDVLRKLQDTLDGHKVPMLLMSTGLSDFAVRRASLYGVVGYARKPLLIMEIFNFSVEIITEHEAVLVA